MVCSQDRMRGTNCRRARRSIDLFEQRFRGGSRDPRGPVVAKPQSREQVQLGRVGTAVVCSYLDQDVLGVFFCIFNEQVEVPIAFKYSCVDQLVLELISIPPPVGLPRSS